MGVSMKEKPRAETGLEVFVMQCKENCGVRVRPRSAQGCSLTFHIADNQFFCVFYTIDRCREFSEVPFVRGLIPFTRASFVLVT